jgi:hypothetical protein
MLDTPPGRRREPDPLPPPVKTPDPPLGRRRGQIHYRRRQ